MMTRDKINTLREATAASNRVGRARAILAGYKVQIWSERTSYPPHMINTFQVVVRRYPEGKLIERWHSFTAEDSGHDLHRIMRAYAQNESV